MTTFTVQTLVSGTTLGNPANNDIQTTAQQSAADGSGTVLSIPTGTLINFPTGAPQEIEIHTPIDPVTAPQLPPGVDAIPVVREFGPTGTQFVPAITVTITYLDQEIVGLNEANLNVFLYDDATGIYDLPVTVTVRDLVNNKISFQVDHFSKYGVGQGVLPDADGDGLSDDDETNLYGTNPNIPDSDGDGLQDAWEVWHLLDPLDDGSVNPDNGANGDPDHDGLTNEYEFAHGGDPQTYDAPITIPAVGFLGLVALTFLLGFVASRRIHRLGRTG